MSGQKDKSNTRIDALTMQTVEPNILTRMWSKRRRRRRTSKMADCDQKEHEDHEELTPKVAGSMSMVV